MANFFQEDFKYYGQPFQVGDLIKNDEPNDLEAASFSSSVSSEGLPVGTFIKLVIDANGNEAIEGLSSTDTATSVFGILLNDNAAFTDVELEDGTKVTRGVVRPDRTARIGRLGQKLSVCMLTTLNGVTEVEALSAQVKLVTAGTKDIPAGSILIGDDIDGITAVALDKAWYRMRMEKGALYLESAYRPQAA